MEIRSDVGDQCLQIALPWREVVPDALVEIKSESQEQVALGGEVAVDGANRDTGFAGDGRNRELGLSAADDMNKGVDDCFTRVSRLRGAMRVVVRALGRLCYSQVSRFDGTIMS